MALRWFSDNSATAELQGAKHWIHNAERMVETLACDETRGAAAMRRMSDYGAGYYACPGLHLYPMHDQLSAAEISRFAGMMLNDRTDGDTCTAMYKPGDGTVVRPRRGAPAGF